MRIFISSSDQTGTTKTTRLSVSNCTDTSELIRLVCKELNLNKNAHIFLVKNEIVNLRILDGWPLSVYGVKNGSWILVRENLLADKQQWSSGSTASLEKIEENSEDLSEQLSNVSLESPPKQSFYTQRQQENYHEYFEKQLEKFLNVVRQNRLDKMAAILNHQPEIQDEELKELVFRKKNYYILNEIGECGRNALHWAIHNQNVEIVSFLLMKFTDPTIETIDQYTPLQLAVVHRNLELTKILMNQPKVDTNKVTSHGTALHLAVYHNCIPLVKYLIDNGATTDLPDKDNKKPHQLSQSKEVIEIFEDHQKKLKLRFLKPNITKGTVLKVSSITWRGKQRLMMLNPFKDDLTLFKQNNVVDHKIKVSAIVEISKLTQKSWLMDSKLSYFKVIYLQQNAQQKLILAIKHVQIMNKWIESVQIAKTYVTNQKYVSKIQPEMQLIQLLDDVKNQVKVHKRQVDSKKQQSPSKKKYNIIDMKVSEDLAEEPISPKNTKIMPKILQQFPEVHFQAEEDLQKSFTSQAQGNLYRDSEILLGSILMEKNFQSSTVYSSRNTLASTCFTKANFLEPTSDIFPQTEKTSHFRKKSFDLVQISEFKPVEQVEKVSFGNFDFIKLLGSGAFGQVYLTKYRKTKKVYAMKVLNKKKLMAKKQLKYAVSQTNILKRIEHPFVVCLYYSFQTPLNLYLALDYCPYGDLSQILCDKQRFTQGTARFIIAQIILAIEYIHKEKIIYRDLKPENILVGKDGYIKVTDFGLSKQNHFATSFCGSPAYLSPQMLQKRGHSYPTDIYGIGCILYEMVVGEPPYYDQNMDQMFDNIRNARLKFPGYMTKEIKGLISRMLDRDSTKRIGGKGMKEIKDHQFFNGFSWEKLLKKQLPVPKDIFPQSAENDYFKLENKEVLNYSDLDYTDNSMLNRIKGFSFMRKINE